MNIKIQLIAFYTLIYRDLRRLFRSMLHILLAPMISILLFFIIFGHIVGQRIGLINGVPYLAFITPALIVIAAINTSYAHVSTGFYIVRFHRSIEEMLISPISHLTLMLGFIVGGMIHGLLVASILYTLISLFFHVKMYLSLHLVFDLALITALFSLAGFLNGLFAKDFDDIAIVPSFILTPLGYLGGAFYTIDMLPKNWQLIAKINPLFHIIQTFRGHALHLSTTGAPHAWGIVLGLMVILFASAFYIIKQPGYIRL